MTGFFIGVAVGGALVWAAYNADIIKTWVDALLTKLSKKAP